MRALDPLGYEKETLAHFQTLKVSTTHTHTHTVCSLRLTERAPPSPLQEVDSMRSAYYSDLCSKFMIENTILKMEYAEVRVFSISDRVGPEFLMSNIRGKKKGKKQTLSAKKRCSKAICVSSRT